MQFALQFKEVSFKLSEFWQSCSLFGVFVDLVEIVLASLV